MAPQNAPEAPVLHQLNNQNPGDLTWLDYAEEHAILNGTEDFNW